MTPRRRRAAALAMLRHLVEHCVEGRDRSDTLRWAAKSLGYPWLACAADCRDPDHVTLLTAPLEEEVDR